MNPTRPFCLLSGICILLLIAGCGGKADGPDLGNWPLTTDRLTLTEDLRVSETEDFYFGSVSDLAITREGHIVLADREANNLKVLRPDGSLLDTLGGSGEGPGEFEQLASVQVARGDSMFAYDVRRSRLTVWPPLPSPEVARTVTFPRGKSFAVQMWTLDDGFVVKFTQPAPNPEEEVSRRSPWLWRRVNDAGTPQDTLLHGPGVKTAIVGQNGGLRVRTVPFARRTITALGPGDVLYHGWTDSVTVRTRALDEPSTTAASIPTDPVPLTEAARDSAVRDVSDEMRSVVASGLPGTKPAFTDLLVSDAQHLWVKRPPEGPDVDMAPWWILNLEEQTIREAQLPRKVDLEVVQNGQAYGTTTTDTGAPAVVRYRVRTDNEA
jgi:hypothetical protein